MESRQVLMDAPIAAIAVTGEQTQKFSLFALTMMVVGSMAGAGIFSLPRAFGNATGPFGAIIAWAITAAGMYTLARVFQALAEREPDLDATLNPLYWPARHEETILVTAIYKFHPAFAGKVNIWWGDPIEDHGLATLEGGDVMPIGKGNVLIGMGERTSRQALSHFAAALFERGAAERVIVAALPWQRAAMHLDTVFTFADRDCVLLYPDIVNSIQAFSYRPANTPSGLELRKDDKPFVDVAAEALGLKKLRVSKPAEMRTFVSARNGTAAPTSSARHPAWSSLMTATPSPIHWCARRASRSSRFRVLSSGAAAVPGTA